MASVPGSRKEGKISSKGAKSTEREITNFTINAQGKLRGRYKFFSVN